jgi:hypothetical protein
MLPHFRLLFIEEPIGPVDNNYRKKEAVINKLVDSVYMNWA